MDDYRKAVAELQTENVALKEDLVAAKENCEEFCEKAARLHVDAVDEGNNLRIENSRLKETYTICSDRANDLHEKLDRKMVDNAQLKREVERLSKLKEWYQSKAIDLQSQLDKANEGVQNMRVWLDEWKAKWGDEKDALNLANKHIEEHRDLTITANKQIAEYERAFDDFGQHSHSCDSRNWGAGNRRKKCDCGFHEALLSLKNGGGE